MKENIINIGKRAKLAVSDMDKLDAKIKRNILIKVHENIINNMKFILDENNKDIDEARLNSSTEAFIDRLALSEDRLRAIAESVFAIANYDDIVGQIIDSRILANGLKIEKIRVPLGVIGMIYEARPNVTVDAFCLAFKSGNVLILKGSSHAKHSNLAITNVIRNSLIELNINPDIVQIITDYDEDSFTEFIRMNEYIDLLIPRGGKGLISEVVSKSSIPVIETGVGNCHIYVDEFVDIDKAVKVILNAKTQRVSVCNACESLVVHSAVYDSLSSVLYEELKKRNVELRIDGDYAKDGEIVATDDDYAREFLDYILSIKVVDSIDAAIEHIKKYSTKHSEAILTDNYKNAGYFAKSIDSACVYINASTRFSDGFEFGLGAEIGISTQKLHARGPMGLEALTSYKYVVYGDYQTRV